MYKDSVHTSQWPQ